MNKIKLVMSDLDNTIVSNGLHVSNIDKNTIDQLIEQNILFVPTTGRSVKSIPEYFHDHPNIEYFVSSNGAMITNVKTNEVIFEKTLDKDVVYEIVKKANDHAYRLMIVVKGDVVMDKRLFDHPDFKNNEFYQKIMLKTTLVDDILEYLKTTDDLIKKVDIGFEDLDRRNDLYASFKEIDGISVVSSHESNIEITHKDASKGNALLFLQDYLKLDNSEIFAIGDNDNDISMLEAAGIGVAMGNASEHVKSHGDQVTKTIDDNGFTFAILNYLK